MSEQNYRMTPQEIAEFNEHEEIMQEVWAELEQAKQVALDREAEAETEEPEAGQ